MQPQQGWIVARNLDVPKKCSVVRQQERLHADGRPGALAPPGQFIPRLHWPGQRSCQPQMSMRPLKSVIGLWTATLVLQRSRLHRCGRSGGLAPNEVERVGSVLGLARVDQGDGYYLVAWEDDEPVGHAHLALTDPPELQDVSVRPEHRRRGVATALAVAAERAVVVGGADRLRLSVSVDNEAALALYRGLGYRDVGIPPRRVHGTIQIRTGPLEVDDTLLTWDKSLDGRNYTMDETNLDIYGNPPLPWSRAKQQLDALDQFESHFFLATVRPDGRPHLAGIAPLWVDGKF